MNKDNWKQTVICFKIKEYWPVLKQIKITDTPLDIAIARICRQVKER